MKTNSRNLGIELLRILAMFGIVLLHVLGFGGILKLDHSAANFSLVWFFEILAFPAANCFAIVSGYVGFKGDRVYPKIKNMISLLFTVLFYSISIAVLFMLFLRKPIGNKDLLACLLPTAMGSYWYFTAYFGLFLLSPVLNVFLSKSNSKQDFIFLIVFSLFSIVSVLHDAFSLLGGYSVIWLILLYLTGAIIKKYNLNRVFSKKVWCIIVLSAFTVTWLSRTVLYLSNIPFLQKCSGVLIGYDSPTVILMAIGLLGLFSNIQCPASSAKTIFFFSTSAFSVYLIHNHFLVRMHLMAKVYQLVEDFDFVRLGLWIIGISLAIFLSCIAIDKIRILLFRIMRIDRLSEGIEIFVKTKINLLHKRIRLKNKHLR